MKKNLITLLPVHLTLAVLAMGIGWLWHDMDKGQAETFRVIESGQAETDVLEMCDTSREDTCHAASSPLSATQ